MRMSYRLLLNLNLTLILTACASHEVRCDRHLSPINPAPAAMAPLTGAAPVAGTASVVGIASVAGAAVPRGAP